MIKFSNVFLTTELSTSGQSIFNYFSRKNSKQYSYEGMKEIISNVSFEINNGDRVGIIGRNGAGKSTLLRLISKIYTPSRGVINVTGRVLPLLELGAGFQPEYTGRENIRLNGAILGYDIDYLKQLEPEIINFADLKESIDIPIKYYSTGMGSRLAFSMITSLLPDILLLDEVFAGGDRFFHIKALNKINSLIGKANIVVMVSHNMSFIRTTTTKILWMENGQLVKQGGHDIIDEYENLPIE